MAKEKKQSEFITKAEEYSNALHELVKAQEEKKALSGFILIAVNREPADSEGYECSVALAGRHNQLVDGIVNFAKGEGSEDLFREASNRLAIDFLAKRLGVDKED